MSHIINMLHILYSIFCYDVWFYVSHIMLHRPWIYKVVHAIHHKKQEPYFQDTYEGHWIESPLQSLGTFFPCFFLHYSVFELAVIVIFLNVRGMMRHDPRCVWLIGNHHLLHHKYPRYNYGEYWLDWLFGTLYPGRSEYVRSV